jgi:hypothetical protein
MSPNRIVAGKRDHRVLFLYNVFKNQLDHNHITAPRTCAYENVDISVVASKYCNTYPDIMQVFEQADLPKLFAGEDTQIMTSCWLGNYAEAADSLVYVPTETVYFGNRLHLTEKTFKAIALEMPFVLVAPAGSLAYLREYGFQTFDEIFDESYDLETDDVKRIEAVTRHPVINKDGTNTMLKITTEEQREVIATKAKSFLKLVDGKIIPVNGDSLKIGDFDSSKEANDYAKTFHGTPYYISPEIINREAYSSATDVW